MPQTPYDMDAVVIGGGFAGLGASRALQAAGLRHVVLEARRPCETWLSQRWDSFRMNTPNVVTVMPGDSYQGSEPEGFMTRDAFVAMVAGFAQRHALPVEAGVRATVEPDGRGGFLARTARGTLRTRAVVAATGNLNTPRRPAWAATLPASLHQIDGTDYRNAAALAPGAALVVGCGNSGGQIAEDLALAGRRVFLATGRNGRVPRRYRGRDIILWLLDNGRYDQPRTTRSGRPLLGSTHTISLESLSGLGVTLLGRLTGGAGGCLHFADDLAASAAHADAVSAAIKAEIDAYIADRGIAAAPAAADPAEAAPARFPDPPIRALDPAAHGITTLIWSVGYSGDFTWLAVPGATDAAGHPQQAGCLSVPGVYFVGLDSMESLKSGTILVTGDESRRVAAHIATHRGA